MDMWNGETCSAVQTALSSVPWHRDSGGSYPDIEMLLYLGSAFVPKSAVTDAQNLNLSLKVRLLRHFIALYCPVVCHKAAWPPAS